MTTPLRYRLAAAVPALIGLSLFVVSLAVLRRELDAVSWLTLTADARRIPTPALVAAVALTCLNFATLTLYEFIAFRFIKKTLPRWRVAGASFVAYAIANGVGLAAITGASVRYRFYRRWGVNAGELSRIMFSYLSTFWIGLLALAGFSFVFSPLLRAHPVATALAAPLGWLLLAASAAYVGATAVFREPVQLGRFTFQLPSPGLALAQLVVSSMEWTLAGGVLFVLLPADRASFLTVLGAFLAAQLLGLASHLPGGVGVFEGSIVMLLAPFYGAAELLPSLIVYRFVYYALPLAVALVALITFEIWTRRSSVAHVAHLVDQTSETLLPRLFAGFAFLAGVVLLFSGATPAAAGRLSLLNRILPLGIIETSHIVGSMAGAALLLLSQGLSRRLDTAYYGTASILSIGIVTSLLKGGDYEEAMLLAALLTALVRGRWAFYRKAAFFETRFSPAWIAAVVGAIGASIWLGFFAYRHIEYSSDLWWQFELSSEAPRFLRASVGAALLVLVVTLRRLTGPAPHKIHAPTKEELHAAGAAIAMQHSTFPFLVYLGDKGLLFDGDRSGFLMYGVQGRTWVALGDPVGPPECIPRLIRIFLERCDDFGGTPVFYKVQKEHLHHYADFGLTFVKLGEEARVDLTTFSLEGSDGAKFRQVVRRLQKDGATFRLIPPADVPEILDQLRVVSDDWLKERSAAEKGFSLGFFDATYLARFPVAVIERAGEVVAFANLWPGPGKEELSIDLMRFHHSAPKNVMEALFVHLMAWGKANGYRWFALGMAPMSGFEQSSVAPLWARVGAFLYDHGDPVYSFRGLRLYKQKFDPRWEPYYLAHPGGLKLPRILADVSALVAGGYLRIVFGQGTSRRPPSLPPPADQRVAPDSSRTVKGPAAWSVVQ